MLFIISRQVNVGDRLVFKYHNKIRQGVVDRVDVGLKMITLEMGDKNTVYRYPYPKRQYRSFLVNKMSDIQFITQYHANH